METHTKPEGWEDKFNKVFPNLYSFMTQGHDVAKEGNIYHEAAYDKVLHIRAYIRSMQEYYELELQKQKEEIVKAIQKVKDTVHEIDGEAFGYELLETIERCCPGDDAAAIYEKAVDDVLISIQQVK